MKNYDVIIIGAGSAGLSAVSVVQKKTDSFLLIDQGPLGTTCARVGCMPSKVLLQVAHDVRRGRCLLDKGLVKGHWEVDRAAVMREVRKYRDHFVSFVLEDLQDLGERFIQGRAEFIGPNVLRIDGKTEVKAKSVIVATGSEPIIPEPFRPFKSSIVTTDEFFEMEDLPSRWAVIGLGPIGLEMGQGLSSLGCEVTGYDAANEIAGLKDPKVNAAAIEAVGKSLPLLLGQKTMLEGKNGSVQVIASGQRQTVDKVLMAVGRRPRVQGMGLENIGARFDEKGHPRFDPKTARIEGTPHFIAGDADSRAPIQHEAVFEGRKAARNSLMDKPEAVEDAVRLGIVFTEPNIGSVGEHFSEIGDAITGEVTFEDQGRSKIMDQNVGRLHIYAERSSGRIIGAEFAAPAGEHLALLISCFIQQNMTLADALRLPYYHPTVEEGLRSALKMAAKARTKN